MKKKTVIILCRVVDAQTRFLSPYREERRIRNASCQLPSRVHQITRTFGKEFWHWKLNRYLARISMKLLRSRILHSCYFRFFTGSFLQDVRFGHPRRRGRSLHAGHYPHDRHLVRERGTEVRRLLG